MSDAQRTLKVSVVTPEGAAYDGEAAHVVAPAFDGEMAFYPMHAPLVGVLGYGELRVTRTDGETEYKVDLDVDGFDPDDLKVELSADGQTVTISGKHEETKQGSSVSRSIHSTFALPPNCKPGEITSSFSQQGVLSVRAPKERPAITNKPEAKTVEIRVSKK